MNREKFDAQKWLSHAFPAYISKASDLSLVRAAYAAGQAAANNGPSCHKCGKLVETGGVLCDEHEQEMIKALIAASKAPASGQKG